jgi:hypothetical protein
MGKTLNFEPKGQSGFSALPREKVQRFCWNAMNAFQPFDWARSFSETGTALEITLRG